MYDEHMGEKLREHLAAIYDDVIAQEYTDVLHAKIKDSRMRRAATDVHFKRLGARDAILITYADQVADPGQAPLATLAEFLSARISPWMSAVHLLPFYPSSSDDGFSVMNYYEVDPAFGDWSDIECVRKNFDLMFDAVFNHASVQGEWFRRFLAREDTWEDAFFTVDGSPDLSAVVRPRTHPVLTAFDAGNGPLNVWTTFSADQADINFADPHMMLRLIDVFLFYLEHGARFIRLDAIAFLWKVAGTSCIHLPETHRAVQLFRTAAEMVDPEITLITETNVPHTLNISYFGDGTNEAHMVYNFALPPLVFHTLRTGDASRLSAWAASLSLPGDRVTFFNFLASHDGIGVNPVRGILTQEEIDALVSSTVAHGGMVSNKSNPDGTTSPYELNINYYDAINGDIEEAVAIDRFVAAHAILFSLRGVPGIYFHSLFGSRGNRSGAEQSGIPRRINREKFLRNELDVKLDAPHSREAQIFTRLREMLVARAQLQAFDPTSPQEVLPAPSGLFLLLRGHPGSRVLCAVNVTDVTASIALPSYFGASEALELLPYQWQWISESGR